MKSLSSLLMKPYPLLVANVWDASSVKAAAKAGYAIVGTSSAAIASAWGYSDGQKMPWSEMQWIISRIAETAKQHSVTLSVDLEFGYGKTDDIIIENIRELAQLGAIGINLEDSQLDTNDVRFLADKECFSKRIQVLSEAIKAESLDIFLNIRVDAFLIKQANCLAETLSRITHYEQAGAEGIFVPGVTATKDIQAIVAHTKLPVNVMALPDLPSLSALQTLGVQRVSIGNFLFEQLQRDLGIHWAQIKHKNTFEALF